MFLQLIMFFKRFWFLCNNVKFINDIQSAIFNSEYQSYRLIIVSIPKSFDFSFFGNEIYNVEFINLSRILAYKMIGLSQKERVKKVESLIECITEQCDSMIFLKKIDILFEPSLDNDPMRLLKGIAKSKTVVAIWPGEITETSVVYSKPGKPDYKTYPLKELNDIQVIDACNGVMK